MILKELTGKVQDTETRRLDPRTHNKAIQKACESYCIPEERKALLRPLKISVKKEKPGTDIHEKNYFERQEKGGT